MGGGSRSVHQHHHVDPGVSGPATAEEDVAYDDDAYDDVDVGADPSVIAAMDAALDALAQQAARRGNPPGSLIEHLVPESTAIRFLSFSRPEQDAAEGTLEVNWRSNGLTYRFSGIPAGLWENLRQASQNGASVGGLVAQEVVGHYDGRLIDDADTLIQRQPAPPPQPVTTAPTTVARCPTCGQFIGGTAHHCPVTAAAQRSYPSEFGTLRVANISALQQHCDFDGDHEVAVLVQALYRLPGETHGHAVHGDVHVPGPRQEFDATAAARALRCSCDQDNCQHAQLAAADLVDRIRSPRVRTPDRRATTAVLGELATDHAASVTAQQAARTRAATGTSYVDNDEAFQTAYQQAQHRISHGEPAVPYQMQDATGGLGAREGGRGFGVELEFDLPEGVNREATLQAIAEDMHRAGISQIRSMDRYHASMRQGYSDARDAWRLERDATVAGEIVSPILYDTPETWRDLATVCDIIRRHGGRASINAGGHVHVSAHNYDHTVENHNRLMRMVDGYQDTLFRLASNPSRGRHRGTNWCRPNTVPSQGYRDIGQARMANAGHHLAVNMQSVAGRHSDHVEFRMWDASLDPGIIQSQIKVSLGLTEAAFRDAGTATAPHPGTGDRVGAHHARFGTGRLQGEQWREATRSFRGLVDSIFHRDSDKEQITGLFAITKWQRG